MKPFNLTDFRNGKKVVTRDGREVKQLTVFDVTKMFPMIGIVGNELVSWTDNGKHCLGKNNETNFDLFHPDEEILLKLSHSDECSTSYSVMNGSIKQSGFFNIEPGTYKLVKVD